MSYDIISYHIIAFIIIIIIIIAIISINVTIVIVVYISTYLCIYIYICVHMCTYTFPGPGELRLLSEGPVPRRLSTRWASSTFTPRVRAPEPSS